MLNPNTATGAALTTRMVLQASMPGSRETIRNGMKPATVPGTKTVNTRFLRKSSITAPRSVQRVRVCQVGQLEDRVPVATRPPRSQGALDECVRQARAPDAVRVDDVGVPA